MKVPLWRDTRRWNVSRLILVLLLALDDSAVFDYEHGNEEEDDLVTTTALLLRCKDGFRVCAGDFANGNPTESTDQRTQEK